MKIGFLSPVTIHDLAYHFPEHRCEDLPKGLTSTMATLLIEKFFEKGHEIVVVTLDKDIKKPMIYKGDRMTLYVGKYGKYGKVRAFTRFANEIKQMHEFLINNLCDVYSAQWGYEFALAALKTNADATIVTLRDNPYKVYELFHDYYRKKRLEMCEEVMRHGKRFVAVSQYIACALQDKVVSEIKVIPNSIADFWHIDEDKKLKKDNPVIIAINQDFSELKNTKNTIKAFRGIRERIPGAELHMYGTDYDKGGKAEAWTIINGLQEGVFFEGRKSHEQLLDVYRKADLLIHASYEESFGNTLLEAMACKTVVLAGKNSGAVPWVLAQGEVGFLVDVSNHEAICDAAVKILSDEEIWDEYANKGTKYVAANFNLDVVAEQYLRCFNGMIEETKV